MTSARRSDSVGRLLRARIAGQSGLVTRGQALSGGFTDEQIRWKLTSSRWVALHPGVYLTTPGRADWQMHAVAALLAVGRPSALCGSSAAYAWGLTQDPGPQIHILVPAGRRRSALSGIHTTRSRAMDLRTDPCVWPHRTTVEHTVLDLSVGKSLDVAVALIAKACQLHLTDQTRMAAALRTRPNQTNHALLAACLADIGEGVESAAELRYACDVERAHGLPLGLRQGPGRSSTTRDSVYEDSMVIVEVDGRRGHEGWRGRQRDGRRDRGALRSSRVCPFRARDHKWCTPGVPISGWVRCRGYAASVRQYLDLLDTVLTHGQEKSDRTGTGTLSIFGHQMRFDLADGFPALTTKKLHLRSIIGELLWFLRGDTNVRWLQERGITIWDEWADASGDLGPIYGYQWRSWPTPDGRRVDQIAKVIEQIRTNPDSRRLIVSAWNVADVDDMALPPCHTLFQFYVSPPGADGRRRLSCQLYQRSADIFLGVPFNIASYALLTQMVAHLTDLEPGEFVHTLGDAHLYLNHLDQARLQLTRTPHALPTMRINPARRSIDEFDLEDFELVGYVAEPGIRAPIAV